MQTREHAAPTAKLRLAAVRHLFDWLVTGQIVPVNPAALVRGPRHVVKSSKTPVLEPEGARTLLDSIDVTTPAGLRDRAWIGAALGMKVEDVFTQKRRLWVRLREKGGKQHEMPYHHHLETRFSSRSPRYCWRRCTSWGEFCEVVGGADHCPFAFYLVDAAEEKLPEASGLLDVSKDGFGGVFRIRYRL